LEPFTIELKFQDGVLLGSIISLPDSLSVELVLDDSDILVEFDTGVV